MFLLHYVTSILLTHSNQVSKSKSILNQNIIFKKCSSSILLRVLGKNYKQVIDLLKSFNIININESYMSSGITSSPYSKSYRLTKEYRDDNIIHINFKESKAERFFGKLSNRKITKNILNKSYINHYNECWSNTKLDVSIIKWLDAKLVNEFGTKQYNPKPVKFINIKNCLKIAKYTQDNIDIFNYYYYLTTLKGYTKTGINKRGQTCVIKIENFLNPWTIAIADLITNTPNVTRHKNTTRIYSNMSSMNSDMRQFLRIDNEHLMESDSKNSQPLLLCVLLKKAFKNWKELDDIVNWVELCESGEIYDFIIDKLDLKIERKLFKKEFFKNIFFTKRVGWLLTKENEYAQLFKDLFPNVYIYILNIAKENKGDNSLPLILQRAESKIWIDIIYKELVKRNIICFTVHDSVLYLEKDKTIVNKIINKAFSDADINPTIKIKQITK